MSRSFYVDSLIIKDTVRPGPPEHPGQDFLIPISMHSPSVMTVSAPVCPSRKSGTFCVCPLCVTSHIHSSRSGIPMLKTQFPGAEAQYCQRITHQQSPALPHPGHTPVCTPTFSVTDPRRYHCLSIGKTPVWYTLSSEANICSKVSCTVCTPKWFDASALLLRTAITRSFYAIYINVFAWFSLKLVQISETKWNYFSSHRRLWEQPHTERKEDAHSFHKHPTAGTWKRIFHEHVSIETQKNRNRHVFKPFRKTGENLVSEPQSEAQEGGQSHAEERAQRVQVHNQPHGLFPIRGWGVSVSGLCVRGEGGVTHLKAHRHLLL